MLNNSNFWIAIGLTTFAGLSTAIGSFIAFFAGPRNFRFLSWGTGFAAGVMIYISFIEIIPKGLEMVGEVYNSSAAAWITTAAFFGGILFIFIIDQLIPHHENPHEARSQALAWAGGGGDGRLGQA
jgi:zinc transporter, ZIP family